MAYSKGVGGGMSAVDAILAEAADLVALEQIARLNTAHLDAGSALPSSLESRFRKLKSLPPTAPAPPTKTLGRSATAPARASQEKRPEDAPENQNPPPPATAVPAARKEEEEHGEEDEDLERLFGPRGRPTLRERNRGKDDDDDSRSPPPTRQACCFGFSSSSSPKKPSSTRRKKKGTHAAGAAGGGALGLDADEWGDENRRMVAELKAQQRRMKEALEEQAKVSRETAKMARWVKQASARMTHTAAIDDLLSDIDDDEELK